ncbi:MAG: DUF2914 domain-containing protein [Bdellovibrionota bacterium]
MIKRAKDLYRQYERWVPIGTFICGFIFDTLILTRIDELKTIIQQAAYLVISGGLIGIELMEGISEIHPPRILKKVWPYREAVLHFLLGTLLNSYTIFFFKSSSALSSFIFIILLVVLLMLNEFKRFGKSQTQVHVAFWSLCLISFLISLAPIVLGFIGTLPFLCAIMFSGLVLYSLYKWFRPKLVTRPRLFRTHVVYPYLGIQALITVLYFAHLIPPVPLSVTYLGIFHGVEKREDGYALTFTRSKWRFWEHGDQTFYARPGDSIYCFSQIFSPSRFKDQLQIRWLYKDAKRGWLPADAIPIQVLGGREEGYRAVTKKSNYQPGEWRVQVETRDNREIGRIGFTVVLDESKIDRVAQSVIR